MGEFWIRAEFAFEPAQFAAFADSARALVTTAERLDPRTTSYHVFADAGAGRATLLERYPDTEAFAAHRAVQDEQERARFYATCRVEAVVVYGSPDREVLELLGGAGATPVATLVAGFAGRA
jgi:quinol monooxygenase YgiN